LYFGTKPGKVYLVDSGGSAVKCKLVSWSMDASTNQGTAAFIVSAKLPAASALRLENKVGSASVSFAVD
jgi:hypothetical protein